MMDITSFLIITACNFAMFVAGVFIGLFAAYCGRTGRSPTPQLFSFNGNGKGANHQETMEPSHPMRGRGM